MRTIIHVGYPKTGTTALQETLYRGRDLLVRKGVLYPDVGIFQGRHANLAWSCMTLGPWAANNYNGRSAADQVAEIVDRATDLGTTTTIISAEDFSYQRPSRYRELVESLANVGSVEVAVYVRPQVEAFESMYKQVVRNRGYSKTFVAFVDEALDSNVGDAPYGADAGSDWGGSLPPYDYFQFASSWAQEVPGGQIRIEEYGDSAKTDIVGDFFRLIDVEVPDDLAVHHRSNKSIEGELIELLRRANEYVPKGIRHRLASDVAWASDELGLESRKLSSPEVEARIRNAFSVSNQRLAERFRNSRPLFAALH